MMSETKKKKQNCFDCGYCKKLMGDAHIGCKRLFVLVGNISGIDEQGKQKPLVVFADMTTVSLKPPVFCSLRPNQWTSTFPFNYDPTWLVTCTGWSEESNKKHAVLEGPLADFASIISKRYQ